MNVFIIQTVIILLLTFIIFYLITYNSALKLEKRISKYSVSSLKDEKLSLMDNISNKYNLLIKSISNILKKSVMLKKYSLKYNKYIDYEEKKDTSSLDFVSNKIIISFIFIFVIVLARIIEGKFANIIDILLSGVIGFFIIDIYYKISSYIKKKLVERDLLNAIIIMNNAFRSGRSTMQAIEIVSKELKGPIKQEFKKMHMEISYGLSLDVVFERFSKRVESEEVSYITSSLSILNKTGGNIIKVFSSIEKMLFDKRKLKQEMKSLTSSSNMISKVLLIIPFIFVLFILLLDKNYFDPLFSSSAGNIILCLIIVLYLLYAFFVNKIMRVRF